MDLQNPKGQNGKRLQTKRKKHTKKHNNKFNI